MEYISIKEILKIGVGPSSSHTYGPWMAILHFIKHLIGLNRIAEIKSIQVNLYGSLAKTGLGHCTDIAIILALMGNEPEKIDTAKIASIIKRVKTDNKITIFNKKIINFSIKKDILFHKGIELPYHSNAFNIKAIMQHGKPISEIYYSVGGGFFEREATKNSGRTSLGRPSPPYVIFNSKELLQWSSQSGLSISEIVFQNERAWTSEISINNHCDLIWDTMLKSIYTGCHTGGVLPGGLNVTRRAKALYSSLVTEKRTYSDHLSWFDFLSRIDIHHRDVFSWLSAWALAVNEENASCGKIVTAPTNGAAGVIPSVLIYMLSFFPDKGKKDIRKFLLTAAQLGIISKNLSTISAAIGGCQAEIGVSSAMAAGALTEGLGGTPKQVIMAAEIAMEHHLGLTCDPVKGLVQVPCIERNAMGAVKAVLAANIALKSNPMKAKVSFDNVLETMWEVSQDMHSKYKETSEGGLATKIASNC